MSRTKTLLFLILILLLPACTPLTSRNVETPQATEVSDTIPSHLPTNTQLNTLSPDQPILLSTNPPGVLATPVSDSPASGICAEPEDEIVVIIFKPDVPDPRCAIVRPDQKLKVINQRGETVEATIGLFRATLPPGTEFMFDLPFGDYLEPGVHLVGCCGGELWLKDN